MICPYCQNKAELVNGDAIYPHRPDLFSKLFYQCKPCDAYVGCHPGGDKPLGRLANKQLRVAKMRAHAAFDPMWKSKQMKRKEAYLWLAESLGIDAKDCHIGDFDVAMCLRVIFECANA